MAFKVRFTEDRDRMSDYDPGDVYDFLDLFDRAVLLIGDRVVRLDQENHLAVC